MSKKQTGSKDQRNLRRKIRAAQRPGETYSKAKKRVIDEHRRVQPPPHTESWFSRLALAAPHQADITASLIEASGTASICSVCGDVPAEDYREEPDRTGLTIRLCADCVRIRRKIYDERFVRVGRQASQQTHAQRDPDLPDAYCGLTIDDDRNPAVSPADIMRLVAQADRDEMDEMLSFDEHETEDEDHGIQGERPIHDFASWLALPELELGRYVVLNMGVVGAPMSEARSAELAHLPPRRPDESCLGVHLAWATVELNGVWTQRRLAVPFGSLVDRLFDEAVQCQKRDRALFPHAYTFLLDSKGATLVPDPGS